jgi:hypothetical protein
MNSRLIALLCLLLAAPLCARATPTEILPLSGMGEKGEAPVYWDFMLDQGRGSGPDNNQWSRILVPSQWEQQGFGTYYYGTQGRGKPDDDPVIPKETGIYKRSFEIPASWKHRDIVLVFEAAMTDTTVLVNGKSAGDTHQGGFYRFSYDITRLVKPGINNIEARVSKESANKSVNHAERRGDYWTFGGIYRPVWLEARPKHHIAWTAIDARADGSFTARLHFDEPVPRNANAIAQVFDAAGKAVGQPFRILASRMDQVEIRGSVATPALWNAETPHLYSVKFTLEQSGRKLHERTERFGFRTLEVRPNDGVYLNGSKIVLKGINRHSFRPATGRTLTREENFADARLIKSANMNAVRMSHYPPDPAFLEAADELGLYVLDELAGWQGFYDTPTGARLIGQIVRRDVNHPSILFWDNGNEGGWNTANDGEFARWDPQARPVLHPWAVHSDINTDHYENYDSTVKLSAGPQIFMPTEFLHGLYDGGIGAGFRDYWDVMGASRTVAGGFFWVFADEGIERTDQDRRIDNVGNAAPDGFVGPHHEKEGSFFAVKEVWSPVQVSELRLDGAQLRMRLRNAYDFSSLEACEFAWRKLRLPAPGSTGTMQVLAEGRLQGPPLAARAAMDWSMPVPAQPLVGNELIELTVRDASGLELWKWTLPGKPSARDAVANESPQRRVVGRSVTTGAYTLNFDADGTLKKLTAHGGVVALSGPWPTVALREQRGFQPVAALGKLLSLQLAPQDAPEVLARATYEGALRSVTWRVNGGELLVAYELEYSGEVDLYGIRFDHPPDAVLAKRWVGEGPYRIWKNRAGGTSFGLHEVAVNDPVPGESFAYPEFPGFFGAWQWLELQSRDARVVIRNLNEIPYFGLHRPQPGKQPVIDVPDLGWSFLHAIPPIGTKFTLAGVLGPQSQTTPVNGVVRGEIALRFLPARSERIP